MNNDPYTQAFLAAAKEAEELRAKRKEIDDRLEYLNEIVHSFARLIGRDVTESAYAESGFTESVAKVLRTTGAACTPADIRDELARIGFDTKRYKSIIPSIVKVLERLAAKGHVDISKPKKGEKKVYIWSPMQPGPANFRISDRELDKKIVEIVQKRVKGSKGND
jgi:hypothetical protein